MPKYQEDPPVLQVFSALSDPTRLAVVERLGIGPASVSTLAQPFSMALPSFMQHLDVLQSAGIVTSHKSGRSRVYQLATQPLRAADRWISSQRSHWDHRLDQLDRLLLTDQPQGVTMSTYIPNPDLDLVLERRVPVSPAKVWAAWTQPELMVQWFTPAPWKTASAVIDLRPGGGSCVTMESPEGEQFPNPGCYLAVEPERLLVFTSVMGADYRPIVPANGADDLPFTARIELTPTEDGGTVYRAIAMHADAQARERHSSMGFEHGWGAALDQLVALMS